MHGIIKLLDPPFEKSDLNPGYIQAYLPGVRENGGQYTHSAIWAIIAFALSGQSDKAMELYKMINPISHSKTMEEVEIYKVEPYVIAADIYGAGNLLGRGGWTWYTGSSSWFYKAGIEYILGLKIQNGYLTLSPHIPQNWTNYTIRLEYKTSTYNIKICRGDFNRPPPKDYQIKTFKLNGITIPEKQVKLIDNNKYNEIEIEI